MNYPKVYFFDKSDAEYLLYLGEFSSLDGLSLLRENLEIEDISLGASNFEQFGWATEKEFPKFKTSSELAGFLKQVGEIGLLVFDVTFKNFGNLHTHDDGECHFKLNRKEEIIEIIKQVSPGHLLTQLLAYLLENPKKYVSVSSEGELLSYHTFDQYLEAST